MKLKLSQIAECVSATGEFEGDAVAQAYSIDSRTMQPGELFFAVRGERLDGHNFVKQALDGGAIAAVVRKDQLSRYRETANLLAVDDTLVALQALAVAVRKLWGKTVVAVTGSMGKTTTKEAISHLLATKYQTHRTKGNFNNHFGLPLGLLKLESHHDIAVVEMGMSHAGEIQALAKIALPNEAVVTNVAPVHLENFTSIEGIAGAKRELIEALPSDGIAVLNADDEYVSRFEKGFSGRTIKFGISSGAAIRAENIEMIGIDGTRFDLVSDGVRQPVHSPLLGKHNVYNVLAAAAIAHEHGISAAQIAAALPSLEAADKRGRVLQVGNITVLNDCYNSSPKALMAAVETLAGMPAKRRIVVAGEMLELGETGEQLHRECGRAMAGKNFDIVLGVRGLAKAMVEEASRAGLRAEYVFNAAEAGEWLARETLPGDLVLLKASRGVHLEDALETWQLKTGIAAAHQS